MFDEQYYSFYLLALLAEVIGTVSGFGSSILFVPIASLYFDFQLVLGITAVFHVFSNLTKIALFRKGIDKNIVIRLGIPAVIFVIIGAAFSAFVPQRQLELLMCILLIALSVFLLLFSGRQLRMSDKNLVISGVGSGFLAGLIGTGGAIRGLTLTAFNLPKDLFIATSAVIDLGVDSSRAVVYFFNGYIIFDILYMIPILIVISILGTWIGKKILNRVPQNLFRYLVLSIIVITSVLQVIHYFAD